MYVPIRKITCYFLSNSTGLCVQESSSPGTPNAFESLGEWGCSRRVAWWGEFCCSGLSISLMFQTYNVYLKPTHQSTSRMYSIPNYSSMPLKYIEQWRL
jgi:hypothetical protein